MTKNIGHTLRGALTIGALATVLLAVPSEAHAGLWDWWKEFIPHWWNSTHPAAVSTPEIDAGLVRKAVAIAAGGLLVLRSRMKRQG